MSERIVRPRAWVAGLSLFGVVLGVTAMLLLPEPFTAAGGDARTLKVLLTAWLLAFLLAGATAFRLLAWTTLRLTPAALEVRSLFGRRMHAWSDIESVTRNGRVLDLRFKRGRVRLLLAHFAASDLAAIAAAAKAPV